MYLFQLSLRIKPNTDVFRSNICQERGQGSCHESPRENIEALFFCPLSLIISESTSSAGAGVLRRRVQGAREGRASDAGRSAS